MFILEKQLKSIYDLYTFSSEYEINVEDISDADKASILEVSDQINQIVFRVHFYFKTQVSIEIIDVLNTQSQSIQNTIHTQLSQLETSIYKTEFLSRIIDETSESIRYICNEIVKRSLV